MGAPGPEQTHSHPVNSSHSVQSRPQTPIIQRRRRKKSHQRISVINVVRRRRRRNDFPLSWNRKWLLWTIWSCYDLYWTRPCFSRFELILLYMRGQNNNIPLIVHTKVLQRELQVKRSPSEEISCMNNVYVKLTERQFDQIWRNFCDLACM